MQRIHVCDYAVVSTTVGPLNNSSSLSCHDHSLSLLYLQQQDYNGCCITVCHYSIYRKIAICRVWHICGRSGSEDYLYLQQQCNSWRHDHDLTLLYLQQQCNSWRHDHDLTLLYLQHVMVTDSIVFVTTTGVMVTDCDYCLCNNSRCHGHRLWLVFVTIGVMVTDCDYCLCNNNRCHGHRLWLLSL